MLTAVIRENKGNNTNLIVHSAAAKARWFLYHVIRAILCHIFNQNVSRLSLFPNYYYVNTGHYVVIKIGSSWFKSRC